MPNWKTYESSVRLLSAIVAAHPNLKLNYDELQKCFGSDATAGGLKFQFATRIKDNVKLINDARKAGTDCKELVQAIAGGVKSDQAIAREYGDGVTGDGGSAVKKTPVKRAPRGFKKSTPTTKSKSVSMSAEDEDDDEEMGSFENTPTKGPLNKVKTGRVSKPSTRPKPAKNYNEDTEDEKDGSDYEELHVKQEGTRGFENLVSQNSGQNGNGDSYNVSFASSHAARQEQWYEAEDLLGEIEEV